MPLREPDMTDCSTKKCICKKGINKGLAYPCDNPCPEGSGLEFDTDTCDCPSEIVCNREVAAASGGAGTTVNLYSVANLPRKAVLQFTYQAYVVPDEFIVEGAASFATNGQVSGSETVYLPIATENEGFVKITVNGPDGTGWNYRLFVFCDENDIPKPEPEPENDEDSRWLVSHRIG